MRHWMRIGVGALLLSTAVACATSGAGDANESSAADLSQAEATTALSALIAHPEKGLRGVGDSVAVINGASDTWTFYPFHQETTSATAKSVADDTESAFLVVGSSGAIFLVDVATGASAGAVPTGVDLKQASARLQVDIHARGTVTTKALHLQGLPFEGLLDAAGEKLFDAVSAAAAKIADSGVLTKVASATKDLAARTVAYFTGSGDTKAADSATTTVAKALEKVGDTADGKVDVTAAKSEPGTAVVVRRASDLEVLKAKTTGTVAVTAEDALTFVSSTRSSVWTPGAEPIDLIPFWEHPVTGARFLVDPTTSAASQKAIADAGFLKIWDLPSSAVNDIAAGSSKLAIGSGDALLESRSDGASRALVQAASTYLVRSFDDSILGLSDTDFIKTPIFEAIDGVAMRALTDASALPEVLLLTDGSAGSAVTKSLLEKVIDRAVGLIRNLGTSASTDTIKGAIQGAIDDTLHPDGGVEGGVTTAPSTPGASAPSVPTPLPDNSAVDSVPSASAPAQGTVVPSSKADDGGCNAAPTRKSAGDVGALALALAVVLVARRRRRA